MTEEKLRIEQRHPDEAFMDAVWDALKGDHNDLRRQAIILEAHRATLRTSQDASGLADLARIFALRIEAGRDDDMVTIAMSVSDAERVLNALRHTPDTDSVRREVLVEATRVAFNSGLETAISVIRGGVNSAALASGLWGVADDEQYYVAAIQKRRREAPVSESEG